MPPVEDGEWIEDEVVRQADQTLGAKSYPGPGSVEEVSATASTEPHPVTQENEEESEPLPEFDPAVRKDFEGLLYLGRLTDEFTWLGHHFVIRTLTVGEIVEVGLVHREFAGTLADAKAYQAAVVAACVESVDGQSLPMPLTNERTDTELINKFRYVMRSWFPPTLNFVYEQYLLLEAKVDRVIEAMGKARGSTDTTPTLIGTSV